MISTLSDRIKMYIRHKGFSQAEFGKLLGRSRSWVNNAGATLKHEQVEIIKSRFPDLNINWLLSGEGEMIVNDLAMSDEIDIFVNSFGVKFVPISEGKYQMIVPLLGASAQASYLDLCQDVEYMSSFSEVESFVVDKPMKGNYLCFRVINDSMVSDDPIKAILPDDILLTRELQRLHWGNKLRLSDYSEWVIYTTKSAYPLVKNISKHDVEKGIITCHSYNNLVPDFDLSLNDVQALFYVIDLKRKRNNRLSV